MHYLKFFVPLSIVYFALTGNLEFSNIVTGTVIATGLTFLLRPQRRNFSWRRLPVALMASVQYLIILIIDIIKNGVALARIVLTPSLPIDPGIVAIPSMCDTELATALSAHAITITPGEMVIEIDDNGVMYTHCLDATKGTEYRAEAQQMRRELLYKIFA